jgi:hypothetical protein
MGISALSMVLVIPLIYLLAAFFGSEELLMLGLFLAAGLMGMGGFVGFMLSLYARLRGGLAVAGAVTGALALLFSFSGSVYFSLAF